LNNPKEIESILFDQSQIKKRVKEIARQIDVDFQGEEVMLVGVLKGAFIFLADLSREIKISTRLDFIKVSSYGKQKQSSGKPSITKDLDMEIKGKNVVVVEDIVDSGLSLNVILENIKKHKPKRLKVCVLLDKREKRKTLVPLDYIGFEVPDKFLVGYGLDFADKYRNLPYVAALKA